MIQSVKIEKNPIFRENANFEKHGCQNSVAMVTSMLPYTSPRLYMFPDKFQVGAKMGGLSLNGFEVIQLFSEGPPV